MINQQSTKYEPVTDEEDELFNTCINTGMLFFFELYERMCMLLY